MKSIILNLALLLTTLSYTITAQEEYPLLKLLENYEETTDPDHTRDSNRSKKNKHQHRNHYYFNDCSLVTRADYRQPNDYSSNFIQLPDGQSYTGTPIGIRMWDNYTYIRITTENSKIPENNITALALDDDNHLWIGTKKSGIVIGSGDAVKPFKIKPIQTRDQNIRSISADGNGFVWVVFENGGIECFLNGISCTYFPYQ